MVLLAFAGVMVPWIADRTQPSGYARLALENVAARADGSLRY